MSCVDQDRTALLADSLRTVAGVVLLTALALGPLNYGSTRVMPFETLIALVATAAAAWVGSCALGRRWAPPPRVGLLGAALAAAAIVAWLLVLSVPEAPVFTRGHLDRLVARWPRSLVPRDPMVLLAWAAAGLAGWLAWCDLLREQAWRRGAAAVMVATGAAIAALGLVQNATGARGIFWEAGARMPGAFFGTFYHHTAAGAYLNTVWPMGLGLALGTLQRGRPSPRRTALVLGSLGCTVLVLAAHAGHVSRAPQVIALLVLGGFAVWAGLWRRFVGGRSWRRLALAAGALAAGAAVVGLGATRLGDIGARWHLLRLSDLRGGGPSVAPPPEARWPRLMRDDLFVPSDHRAYPLGDRGAGYATAARAIADRPWFGWGPGGWTAAAAAHSADPFLRTFFLWVQFTHCDPLQAAVEWGVPGAAGWIVVVGGGAVVAAYRLGRRPEADPLGAAAVAGLFAVGLQSLLDFPLQIPGIALNALVLSAFAWTAREPKRRLPV